MKILGITGSIGMGKSTVSNLFRHMGVPVFDSDVCVRNALQGAAKNLVLEIFPSAQDEGNGTINRQKLADLIFMDISAREALESLLHPIVWREQDQFMQAASRAGRGIIGLDIPLLFETGRDKICSKTICVTAPEFIQKQRVLARPGMTEDRYNKIIATQFSDAWKQGKSDFIIQTGLGRGLATQQVKKILRIIA